MLNAGLVLRPGQLRNILEHPRHITIVGFSLCHGTFFVLAMSGEVASPASLAIFSGTTLKAVRYFVAVAAEIDILGASVRPHGVILATTLPAGWLV